MVRAARSSKVDHRGPQFADGRNTDDPWLCALSVATGMSDQGTVCYVEEWRSEADFRRHLESHTFTSLATLIDDATDPPRIEFMLPGGTRGLDFVEEVRRRKR